MRQRKVQLLDHVNVHVDRSPAYVFFFFFFFLSLQTRVCHLPV